MDSFIRAPKSKSKPTAATAANRRTSPSPSVSTAPNSKERRHNQTSALKITTVLFLESIEDALPFWVDRIGFEKTAEVPEGDRIGFVILVRNGAELMLQSTESARKDVPAFAPAARPSGHIVVFAARV